MAAQTTTSGLAKRFGGRLDAVITKHAHDETEYGFQRLPAGINNGVAQVTKCYFDTYKKGEGLIGEYYLRCEAVVVSPIMLRLPDGSEMRVAGLTTSIMRPLCQIKRGNGDIVSQDESVAEVMNELRKLGGDTSGIKDANGLESLASAIAKARPFTRFDTSVREPRPNTQDKPGTWENWRGSQGLEDFSPPTNLPAGMGVDDQSATSETQDAPSSEQADAVDHAQLVALAIGGDKDAQDKLVSIAEETGGEMKEKFDAIESWEADGAKAALYDAFGLEAEPEETTEEVTEEVVEEADDSPKVGEMRKYKPMVKDAKGMLVRAKVAVQVQIVEVDKLKRTAKVKMLKDKKVINGVSWDGLE